MSKELRLRLSKFVALTVLLALLNGFAVAGQSGRDVSREPARASREWAREGVIYEIFPRNFSAEGNFNGITARLDDLKNLGVTILWLMQLH